MKLFKFISSDTAAELMAYLKHPHDSAFYPPKYIIDQFGVTYVRQYWQPDGSWAYEATAPVPVELKER